MSIFSKQNILLALLLLFTIAIPTSSQSTQTIDLTVFLNETSFIVVVENTQNQTDQSISLRDFGFTYEYNGNIINTKLSNYRGFEAT
ncbi:MAG: hypothetical protein AAFV93_23515, partial [Chloroflexota bacterium]